MQVVIPSKNRPEELQAGALRLFPSAIVCVGESDVEQYSRLTDNLLVHPDSITGIGPVRQWILDTIKDDIVVQVDDDVHTIYSLCGFTKRVIDNADAAMRILATTAHCAAEAGVSAFGFNQAWDVRKYRAFCPIALKSWAGGVVGFVGRKHRYDTDLKLRADIDFFLTCLRYDRFVWIENRYAFVHKRWVGSGGNAINRSTERHEAEINFLKKKWGKYLSVQGRKSTVRLAIQLER